MFRKTNARDLQDFLIVFDDPRLDHVSHIVEFKQALLGWYEEGDDDDKDVRLLWMGDLKSGMVRIVFPIRDVDLPRRDLRYDEFSHSIQSINFACAECYAMKCVLC